MDALPWSRWHLFIVLALGITWVLDGLEVTLAGAVGSTLLDRQALRLTEFQVGLSATCYLAGAVVGALLFGHATDRFGRKRLFFYHAHCLCGRYGSHGPGMKRLELLPLPRPDGRRHRG
jgi:predicted MFS family arabinose efflux permease